MKKDRKAKTTGGAGGLLLLPFVAAGTWIVYSKFMIDHEVPLPEAVEAKRVVFRSKLGLNLNYYVDQGVQGRPLVLLHGINSGASAYDMKPLFEHYRATRPVYALELPGFGFSERPKRTYTAQYFAEAILDFLETQVEQAADLAVLSLSCEFAARAAVALPDLLHSLAFISPTGLGQGPGGSALQLVGTGNRSEAVYGLIANPIWAQAAFDLLALRVSLERMVRLYFVKPAPTDLVDYAYATAHQPGAKEVPLAALSGLLNTADVVDRFYRKVQVPTLVLYDRDPFAHFEALPELLASNDQWQVARIVPSLGMPHFEKLAETTSALDDFWAGLDS